MSYLSLAFAGLVLVMLVLYRLASIKRAGWVVLLLGSLVFYCCFDLKHLIFLSFTALSTYLCALGFQKASRKKLLFILCIAANVGVWFFIKVLPWTFRIGNILLSRIGLDITLTLPALIVPVGISYFTLQAVGYLADVYSGKIQPEKNIGKYLTFLAYFPAIVQGPISRYNELMPQLLNTKPFCFETMRKGLILILFGLVKKLVVADRLAIFVNACFAGYESLSGVILYLAAVGYAIQLYMDFSGCVDICRGVSTLFNVELVNNFNRPYLATSIKDFWGRWHMSLSRWLKDYIYIPLGGNRKGTFRKYINLMITFLVSGLWHGAGFCFFLWGALHALFQITGQCTANLRSKIKQRIGVVSGSVSERIYQTVITFNLVTFAWIFFRIKSVGRGIQYLRRMLSEANLFALTGKLFELGVNRNFFLVLLLHIIGFFAVELCTKNQDSVIEGITQKHIIIRWVIYLALLFDVILLGAYGSGYDLSGFMYGGF